MDEVATGADDEKPTIGDEGSESGLPADLEREVAELRRRLIDTPRELHRLESEVRDVKRELARVSVRAAMLVRLRALDVVLGRSPRPESSTDRKEAKRAKATRLAAVHVVSESGIPADRGSFGA